MSERNTSEANLTRRELLAGGGMLLAGIALGGTIGSNMSSPDRVSTYESSDIIETPFGEVAVEDWKVLIPEELFERASSTETLVSFQLIDEDRETQTASWGGSFVDLQKKKGKDYRVLHIIPKLDGSPVFLIFTSLGSENTIDQALTYPIQPTVYTESGGKIGSVMAEESIGGENFRQLSRMMTLFDEFSPTSPIYLHKRERRKKSDKSISSAGNNYDKNRIEMSTTAFTQPVFSGEGMGLAFHELSHDIIKDLVQSDKDPSISRMNHAYTRLMGENSSLATMLTESTYIDRPGANESSDFGHPEDSPNEMFASTLTIMRFYHKPFLENFKKLQLDDKKRVASFIESTFKVLDTLNNSKPGLHELLPATEEIKETILTGLA